MPDRWGSKRKPSSSERKLMEQKSREQIVNEPIGPGPPPTLDRNLGMGVYLGFRKIGGKMVRKALLLHSSWWVPGSDSFCWHHGARMAQTLQSKNGSPAQLH